MSEADTIFAIATASGKAGVAVMRISGAQAGAALIALCHNLPLPSPRRAVLRRLSHPATSEALDNALVLWLPAPHSFTGEDTVELHLHGSRAVISGVTEALAHIQSLRPAEAGEFTRRAFYNNRLDLTEVEALSDLIAAETAGQRRQALRQMEGELGELYNDWAERLKRIAAHLEADIDFADEDLPPEIAAECQIATAALLDEIELHLNDNHRGERLRHGLAIAVIGAPNAGKSSLLNALARRDAAIVSPHAGTTRDVIDVALEIGGHAVIVADTAGLRTETTDTIESEGIRRARERAMSADIRIVVLDGEKYPNHTDPDTMALYRPDDILVINKADLLSIAAPSPALPPALLVSAKTEHGIPELESAIKYALDNLFPASEAPPLTRARHRHCLEECAASLRRALLPHPPELRAEDTRLALRALGRITGSVGTEDLLDIIFREFCLGK